MLLAAIVFLAVGGLLAYQYGWRDSGPVRLPTVEACMLHLEPCSASLPAGGSMIVEVSPRRPQPTDTLRLNVSFDQVEPSTVGVRFKGVNMKMGYLEHYVYELQRNQALAPAILFDGNAGVFACSSNLMEWLVLVRVELDNTLYEVPFKFETLQRG